METNTTPTTTHSAHVVEQAQRIIANDEWDGGLGWDINHEVFGEVVALLKQRIDEITKSAEAFNFACDSECEGEGRLNDFGVMASREYFDRYYGPKCSDRAFGPITRP